MYHFELLFHSFQFQTILFSMVEATRLSVIYITPNEGILLKKLMWPFVFTAISIYLPAVYCNSSNLINSLNLICLFILAVADCIIL